MWVKTRSSPYLTIRLCSTSYCEAELVERVGHQREAVAEDVDVDVGALADVPGPDAADQPGPEPRQQPHEPQGIEPHVAQVLEALGPLVHPGHRLDLVADLPVAGQVAGPMAILDAKLAGGLALGGEVLGLGPADTSSGRPERRSGAGCVRQPCEEVRRFEPIEAARGEVSRVDLAIGADDRGRDGNHRSER